MFDALAAGEAGTATVEGAADPDGNPTPEGELIQSEGNASPAAETQAGEALPLADSAEIRRRRLKLIAVAAGVLGCVLAVVAAAGAAIIGARPAQVEVAVNTPSSFQPLPEVVGTLAPEGRRPHWVRIGITLELGEAHVPQVKTEEAAIMSTITDHLLDLRTTDLAGREGAESLRAFIRDAVEARSAPGVVRSVLFTTLIVD